MTPGRLVAFRNDRLGARLLSLVNAWRLARDLGAPLRMHWPVTTGVGAEFNDPTALFDERFVAEHFIDADAWRALRPGAERLGRFEGRPPEDLAAHLQAGGDVEVGMAFGITALRGEDAAEVAAQCRAIFQALPFAAPLDPLVKKLKTALDGAVAYHIRRGDLSDDIKARNRAWPHKYVPLEYYHAHIDAEVAHARRVILFSDNPEIIARLQADHPQLCTISDFVDVSQLDQGARDFAELMAMSCCDRIIAPEASAFSTTAADLGGAVKLDVKDDLAPDALKAANEVLLDRLRRDPGSFAGDGDLGQSLPHMRQYLEAEGRGADAMRLYRDCIERGLEVSFIFAQAMSIALAQEDPDGALAIAGIARQRTIYHDIDLAMCSVLEAVAQCRIGQHEAARRALAGAVWIKGDAVGLRRILPALILRGALDADNFLPAQPEVIAIAGRRLSPALLRSERIDGVRLAPLLTLGGGDAATGTALHAGSSEPLWWDWEPLLGTKLVGASLEKGLADRYARRFEKALSQAEGTPAIRGGLAMIEAHRGDTDAALARLRPLAEAGTGDAMTWQRISHVHMLRRDHAAAAEAATEAAKISEAPAFRAWAGLCLQRDPRRASEAIVHLRAARDARLGFASIPALLATELQRAGELDGARDAIDEALRLAPNSARFAMTRCRILVDLGETATAKAALSELIALERAPMPAYPLLAKLHIDTGETAEARATLERGLARKPGHAQITELLGRVA